MPLTRTLLAALCLAGLTLTLTMAQETPDSVQQKKSFKAKITTRFSANYLLFLPRDYEARKSQRWPLILFLHGAGERGTDGFLQTEVGIGTAIRKNVAMFPALVVMPQCRPGQLWVGPMGQMALPVADVL